MLKAKVDAEEWNEIMQKNENVEKVSKEAFDDLSRRIDYFSDRVATKE